MDASPFPIIYSDELGTICDGLVLKKPTFCGDNLRKKCKKYYKEICSLEGFHQCPYGYSSFVHIGKEASAIIYTGLSIDGHYDKKKLKGRDGKSNLILAPSDFRELLRQYTAICTLNQFAIVMLRNLMHDVRRINGHLKLASEYAKKAARHEGSEQTRNYVHNIFELSSLMSTRLNSIDFEFSPETFEHESKKTMGIYKKFDKYRRCFQILCQSRGIVINFPNPSHRVITAPEIFELLPFSLLNNAIDYSPDNQPIDILFQESDGRLLVCVENIGPYVSSEELKQITERGFRGKQAQRVRKTGMGLGLNLSMKICQLCNIKLSAESEIIPTFNLNNIQYGKFIIKLLFPQNLPVNMNVPD